MTMKTLKRTIGEMKSEDIIDVMLLMDEELVKRNIIVLVIV